MHQLSTSPASTAHASVPARHLGRQAIVAACLWLVLLAAGASSARADSQITSFSVTSSSMQAGAHPDVTTNIQFATSRALDESGNPGLIEADQLIKDIQVDLPPGLLGDPTGIPKCAPEELVISDVSHPDPGFCNQGSQVGVVGLTLQNQAPSGPEVHYYPVYNMVPEDNQVALLAFSVTGLGTIPIQLAVRSTGDYGVRATMRNLPSWFEVLGATLQIWGVPADHSHDLFRTPCINQTGLGLPGEAQCASLATPKSFMVNPTQCSKPLVASLRADFYQARGVYHDVTSDMGNATGCDLLSFHPSLSFAPQSRQAGSPSGFDSMLAIPQSDQVFGLATAHLRRAVVTLPEGVAIDPASADGLGGCTDAQVGITSTTPVTCPDASKIGTVQIVSPLLRGPLQGSIFLGSPASDDPASGKMFRIFLVAEGFGLSVRLEGAVVPDPATGRLVATFENTPEVAFSELRLHFKGGARAPLSNPPTCGAYNTHWELTPHSGAAAATGDAPMAIDQGCAVGGFAPTLNAGVTSPVAGAQSPFSLTFSRKPGEQELRSIDVVLPPGLLGNVGSVPLCQEAQAAAGTCPEDSRVGSVTALAGNGSSPLSIPQAGKAPTAAYLAGPYKGAPLSLSMVVPAQAGPYDLGTVVVRAALFIDKTDGHVTVKADPIPAILDGVPLRIQSVTVNLDRAGFMVNPTSCSPMSINAAITSTLGTVANAADRFQVGDCASLPFAPSMTLKVGAARGAAARAAVPSDMKDGGHPALSARVQMPAGQANITKAEVALPLALALDPDNANGLCEPSDAEAEKCPESSIVGSVAARTPLLKGSMSGPVYFVRGERRDPKSGRVIRTLPKLFIPLSASDYPGVQINLHAGSEVREDRLVTTFDDLPDVPISTFDLTINGGKHGILVVSNANMCSATQHTDSEFGAQNGKAARFTTALETSCGLAVRSSSRSGSTLKVAVAGVGAGKVVVSGKGLTKSTRWLRESTTVTVSVPINRTVRAALARGHNVTIKTAVSFTPRGSTKAQKISKSVTLHPTKKTKM
jgi:hypothetical protein